MAYTTEYAEKAQLQVVPNREFDDLTKIGGRIEVAADKLEAILKRFRPEREEGDTAYPTGAVGYVGELSNCRAHLCRLENLIGELDRIA